MDKLSRYDTIASKDILKINWTYNSNAIEGNTISFGDTADIIQYGLTIKGKSIVEHSEVVGHARAIDLVYRFINNDTFSEDDLFLLHKAVQTNLVVDIECPLGAYKVVENGRYIKMPDGGAEFYSYPHPNDIKHLMNLWFKEFGSIKELDDFEECIDKYTDIHISFTAIHPFFDGNGRVARLIANIPLLKSNYLPIIIDNNSRETYIELLSNYNLSAKPLNKNSITLVEKNQPYNELRAFFKEQYKNAKEILDTIRRAK